MLSRAQTANDYRAFEIVVKSPIGFPVPQAEVMALDGHKKEFGKTVTNEDGLAKICGAPAGLIDIRVGGTVDQFGTDRIHTFPLAPNGPSQAHFDSPLRTPPPAGVS